MQSEQACERHTSSRRLLLLSRNPSRSPMSCLALRGLPSRSDLRSCGTSARMRYASLKRGDLNLRGCSAVRGSRSERCGVLAMWRQMIFWYFPPLCSCDEIAIEMNGWTQGNDLTYARNPQNSFKFATWFPRRQTVLLFCPPFESIVRCIHFPFLFMATIAAWKLVWKIGVPFWVKFNDLRASLVA